MKLKLLVMIFVLGINSVYSQTNILRDTLINNNSFDSLENTHKSLSELKFQTKFEPYDYKISTPIILGLSAAALGTGIAVYLYEYNAWWKDKRSTKFRVIDDWEYALWIDKIGHLYATTMIAHGLSSAFDAANFPPEKNAIYSSLGALLFQTYIEIEDGYGAQWGFSPGDFYADVLGAGYHLAKYYYPVVKNFQPRVSYYPSKKYLNGEHKDGNIIDDYEGQKYWLSLRMKELLPKDIAKYWPSFLMLSVGMGVSDLDGRGGGNRELYISFDLDWQTLPIPGKIGQLVKNTLNYFHLPMPGVKISPKTTFLVFCY
ncbi:MAG: DUF2279 domain-containing protein [bacterium]